MSKDIKFEQSSGNVFQDIGFPDAEAERELLKADLAFEIHTILEKRKLTQAEAGEILSIDQADVSRLKNGEFDRFSVERLFTFLNRLDRNVEIRISPSEDTGGHQRVNKQTANINLQRQIQFGNFAVVRMLSATQVDYPDSEEHLMGILRSYNYEAILIALARINLLLQRTDDPFACERTLQNNFCSDVLRNEIERRRLTDHIIFHREATLRLLSESVRVADPNSNRLPDTTDEARHELTRCYLIANQRPDSESPDIGGDLTEPQRKELLAEMIANFEYAVNHSPWHYIKNTIVRSEDFLTRLQRISSTFDVNKTFYQATGLTLTDYQNLIFSVLLVTRSFTADEILKGTALFVGTKPSAILAPLYDELLQHTCITIDELVHRAETTPSLPNEFRLWRKYPLIKLRGDQIMCIDLVFLLDKLETGVFWIVRDYLEKEKYGKGEEIIGLRGRVFEDYAASMVERGINAQTPPKVETCIIRPKYTQKQQAECVDIAVCGDDTLILLECKAPFLSAETKFSREFSEFYKGIKPNVIKGTKQLSTAIQFLGHKDDEKRYKVEGIDISKVKKIYPVLLLPDRLFSLIFMNRFLNAEFQRFIKRNDLQKEIRIMPLTVLTIGDLEDLEPYLCDTPFHAHLNTWITQVFEHNESFPFNQYLRTLMADDMRQNTYMNRQHERIFADLQEYLSSRGVD